MSILAGLETIIAALKSGGIAATLDPRDLNPPGAWAAARRAEDFSLCNRPTILIADVYLIVRDVGAPGALAALDELLELALDALGAAGIGVTTVALDEALTIPSGGAPLPAYRLTVQVIGE